MKHQKNTHAHMQANINVYGPSLMPLISLSVQFSRSVVLDFLWPHGLQHARLPCPSPTPRVYSNSCPSSQWCHPTILSSVIRFSSHLQFFLASWSFLRIRWQKFGSFTFSSSPSKEYRGLISSRTDWLNLLAVQEALKSSPTHSSKASMLQFSAFF